MTISFLTIPNLIRAERLFVEKKKNRKSKNMAEKTFMPSQALDYLNNLEVNSDSEEKSLGGLQSEEMSSLHSIPIDKAVMLILVIKTQQQQIQVILVVINFLVLLYWK